LLFVINNFSSFSFLFYLYCSTVAVKEQVLEYGKDLKRQVIMYTGNARGHGGKENGSSDG
jgi:hypothetical protein